MHLSYHGKRTIAITKTPGDSFLMNRRVSLGLIFSIGELRNVYRHYKELFSDALNEALILSFSSHGF